MRALAEAGFQAVQLDVNDAAALARLAEELEVGAAGLDVLVNNAGYGAMGPLLDGGVDAMRRQFETNVFAVVGVTRALFPLLRRKSGLVVNVGSVSGVLVTPFAGAYCASKAAVHALSDALRLELAPFGVEVLEVQPGAIASNFGASASREREMLCVVESPADRLAIENATGFRGVYFVLQGRLSPLDGIGPRELGLEQLFDEAEPASPTRTVTAPAALKGGTA